MRLNNWQFSKFRFLDQEEINMACGVFVMCSTLGICDVSIWTYVNDDYFRVETF